MENSLIQVITPTDTIQYKYDPYGRRIARILNGTTTRYIYDNEDILLEVDVNGTIRARYTHGPGIDEPLSVKRDTNGDGTLDTTYYYHTDGLGSVTTMTNSAGSVVQSYTYDTFGNITSQTGTVENSYTYTGREWDAEAGLYYYRARYYDANIGRFITEDPIGFNAGVNFYPYISNNPVNFVDSTGLSSKCCDGIWSGKASRLFNVRCKCYWRCTHSYGDIWSSWYGTHQTQGWLKNGGGGAIKRGGYCQCPDPSGITHDLPITL